MARKPKGKAPTRHSEIVAAIREHLSELESLAPTMSNVGSKKMREVLDEVRLDLSRTFANFDPIKEPTSFFDPSDPQTAGRLVAVALLAQPRVPLDLVPRSYGAGVYAIYYIGNHPTYAVISGTETPIYVGKADPSSPQARSPRDQGDKLYGRLADHRKAIKTVEKYAIQEALPNPLHIADFECRRLVTATNAQLFAEAHLIDLFRPLWNKSTNVCWGISKHGDTEGRSNSRSPWDVLHPGRKWAMLEKLQDSRPTDRILQDIVDHYVAYPPFTDRDDIVDRFLEAFAQDPMVAAAPVDDGDVEEEIADGSESSES